MKIPRTVKDSILKRLKSGGKIVIIYGPRQVGKTTLGQEIIAGWQGKTLAVSADELRYIEVLSCRDSIRLKSLVSGYDLLFIDEAQRVPDIGINLKILHDQIPELRILVTGSSSFDLANSVCEPLTGRTWTCNLHPVSFVELSGLFNRFELDSQLEERLVFGSYPEVFSIGN
ncbi:MAG: AAA family ATPase, partial [Candidatus Wallbacteria bacterium]|nr:AAA family ATPase [Candidatus Wallbacteria bacterium]